MAVHIPEQTFDKVKLAANDNIATFVGEIDASDPGIFLTPFFRSIIEQMGQTIAFDFTQLDFLNSSGIKCIVSFVMEKDPDAHVTFYIDSHKTWQRKSLEVIQSLDEDSITIEDKE